MPVTGLDDACGACGRISGDHTLREWAACLGEATLDLPYRGLGGDEAERASKAVHEQFKLDPDLIVADNVYVKAAVLNGASATVHVAVPALLHEFQSSALGKQVTVAKVLFLGDLDSMRAYGRLARDSANGAANAAEGK